MVKYIIGIETRKEKAAMVKMGTLKDYRNAKEKIRQAGILFTEKASALMRQVIDTDGKEIVSVAKFRGNTWIFRYNETYFKEAISEQ